MEKVWREMKENVRIVLEKWIGGNDKRRGW